MFARSISFITLALAAFAVASPLEVRDDSADCDLWLPNWPSDTVWISGASTTFTWVPSGSPCLINTLGLRSPSTGQSWVVGNDIDGSAGSYTFTLPGLPDGDYLVTFFENYPPNGVTWEEGVTVQSKYTVDCKLWVPNWPADTVWTSGAVNTFTWVPSGPSPCSVVTLGLHSPSTGQSLQIGNDIDGSAGTYTFTLPTLSAGDYLVSFLENYPPNGVTWQEGVTVQAAPARHVAAAK